MKDDDLLAQIVAGIVGILFFILGRNYVARQEERASILRRIENLEKFDESIKFYVESQKELKEDFKTVRDAVIGLTITLGKHDE